MEKLRGFENSSDSPNLIALVSCKLAWNLVIEAMMKICMLISVSLVWKVENVSWISAQLNFCSAMSKREALLSALAQLRVAHPALPQLRDFQVSRRPFHAVRIQLVTMSSVGHTAECFGSRWSKSYPLRSAYGLWEDHAHVAAGPPFASRCWNSNLGNPMLFKNVSGSVTMILVPLITIELQLLEDCKRLGLTAIAGSQVNTWSFPPLLWSKIMPSITDTEALF